MQADSAQQQGLYRPEFDHDACGIGALADINGERHHQILDDALSILVNLEHRGGTGLEKNTGDGAGILFQVPHHFFRKEAQKVRPDSAGRGRLWRGHAVLSTGRQRRRGCPSRV